MNWTSFFHPGSGQSLSTADDIEVPMPDMTIDRWLSVDEIADYLGVKRDTIYKWIERKKMPAHKVGSLWKFKKEEIDRWVRAGKAAERAVSRKPR